MGGAAAYLLCVGRRRQSVGAAGRRRFVRCLRCSGPCAPLARPQTPTRRPRRPRPAVMSQSESPGLQEESLHGERGPGRGARGDGAACGEDPQAAGARGCLVFRGAARCWFRCRYPPGETGEDAPWDSGQGGLRGSGGGRSSFTIARPGSRVGLPGNTGQLVALQTPERTPAPGTGRGAAWTPAPAAAGGGAERRPFSEARVKWDAGARK